MSFARAPFLLVFLMLGACVESGTGGSSGGGGGGGGGDGGAGGSDAGGGEGGAGTYCTVQTTSGSFLCEGLSRCASVMVEQNTFPQCGFVVAGSSVELTCECSGYLCSGGTAMTCGAAAALLEGQTAVTICNQLSTGGCQFEGLSGSGTGSGSCSSSCSSTCVGDPQCLQACGC